MDVLLRLLPLEQVRLNLRLDAACYLLCPSDGQFDAVLNHRKVDWHTTRLVHSAKLSVLVDRDAKGSSHGSLLQAIGVQNPSRLSLLASTSCPRKESKCDRNWQVVNAQRHRDTLLRCKGACFFPPNLNVCLPKVEQGAKGCNGTHVTKIAVIIQRPNINTNAPNLLATNDAERLGIHCPAAFEQSLHKVCYRRRLGRWTSGLKAGRCQRAKLHMETDAALVWPVSRWRDDLSTTDCQSAAGSKVHLYLSMCSTKADPKSSVRCKRTAVDSDVLSPQCLDCEVKLAL
mmetsp:Transcript_32720/g.52708  ORF Transcript_32720/g.52708 Transcript_32720/m.52708 type:complete len:287 (-) Transcript_32720:53-913(-)